MQSGRNISLEDRGTAKTGRNAEEKRKKLPDVGRGARDAKTNSSVIQPESKKRPQIPTAGRVKPKVSAPDDNRLSYSIQKLLSVYETSNTEKSPDRPRSRVAEEKRTKIYTKPSRNNVNKVADARGSRINGPVNAEKIPKRRASLLPRLNVEVKKTEEATSRRPAKEQTKPPSNTGKTESSRKGKDKETERCEELIPLLTPDRTSHSPVGVIDSFIANYLDQDPAKPSDDDRRLPTFLFPETSGNAFPVCGKRATDNIPLSDRMLPEMKGSAGDLIIMLRRRNSEPYSAKNCILQCTRPEGNDRLPLGFGCDEVENFYFWEPGVARANKPYWEVSLFRSNKSLTVLSSGNCPLTLASPKDTGDVFVSGSFNNRNHELVRTRMPPFADLNSCSSPVRAIPFLTPLDKERGLPRVEMKKDKKRLETRPRGISKDDHYKPPARLLVYVKSSQKKFLRSDSKARNVAENLTNKKIHKIKKIFAVSSETRATSCHRLVLLAVASAVFLITGGLAFFLYFLAKRHAIFNLTPPIPGLLRGC